MKKALVWIVSVVVASLAVGLVAGSLGTPSWITLILAFGAGRLCGWAGV